MKITIDEITSKKQWLHKEIISSLSQDLLYKLSNDGYIDVKIVVNGEELEPKFYNDLIDNIDVYVEETAKQLIKDKFSELESKLHNMIGKLNEIEQECIKGS